MTFAALCLANPALRACAQGAHITPTQQGGTKGPFRVGDIVLADFFGNGHWVKAKIVQVYPTHGPVSQYTVEDATDPDAHGAEAQLAPGSVRSWAGAGVPSTQPVQPASPAHAVDPATAPEIPAQFKVGDRVLTSINSASGDYQPCTIMGPLSQGVYPVRCDPYKGRQYTDWGAFPQFIKPWPGAAPAPIVQACSFSVPGGTVTKNSPPTAQTFQRVIYNMAAVSEEGRWGMTFTRFDIGTPFKNELISNAMGGVETAHRNAPQGGVIYPITSEYVRCVDLDATYNERTIVDVNWACMKNNDGDWDCPTYSTAQVIKRERVPK